MNLWNQTWQTQNFKEHVSLTSIMNQKNWNATGNIKIQYNFYFKIKVKNIILIFELYILYFTRISLIKILMYIPMYVLNFISFERNRS